MRYSKHMSPFVHAVHFWLQPDVSDERRAALVEALKGLGESPNVASCRVGVPAGTDRPVVDNSYDVQLVCGFNSVEDHDRYQSADDTLHTEFIENFKDTWAKVVIYDSVEV